jgi:hypothetical protein
VTLLISISKYIYPVQPASDQKFCTWTRSYPVVHNRLEASPLHEQTTFRWQQLVHRDLTPSQRRFFSRHWSQANVPFRRLAALPTSWGSRRPDDWEFDVLAGVPSGGSANSIHNLEGLLAGGLKVASEIYKCRNWQVGVRAKTDFGQRL